MLPGAPADGTSIEQLDLDDGVWVSLAVRGGQAVHVHGSTVLAADDEVVLLVDPESTTDREPLFASAAGR